MTRAPNVGKPLRSRGGVLIGAILVLTAAVGFTAFQLGRRASSPAKLATQAREPRTSLLTAPVTLRSAQTTIVLRGTLRDGGATPVPPPGGLSGDLPVVTDVPLAPGARVDTGTLIGAVAGRPVFVMAGQIPAYSTMSFGSTGVDVSELQSGLASLGLTDSPDASGHYGLGTAAAVAAFYRRAGYTPTTTVAIARLKSSPGHRTQVRHYASVPLGEVVFTPQLPSVLESIAHPGQLLDSGRPLAELASGRLTFTTTTDANTGSLLRVGVTGRAESDLSQGTFAIRLTGIRATSFNAGLGARLTFAPVSAAVATRYVGQNMALRIDTGRTKGVQLVVPVSAVVTTASGASSVTVVRGARRVEVTVHAGLVFQGQEVVRPIIGGLAPGNLVAIGLSNSG